MCSKKERRRERAEREAGRGERKPGRGGEQAAGAGAAPAGPERAGESWRGWGSGCYLTPDRESRSRRNTKKARRSLALARSPRPAPCAPLAEHGSRRSANFISQRPNSRRAKAAAQGPSPTLPCSLARSPPFKSERKKRKQRYFFFFLAEC